LSTYLRPAFTASLAESLLAGACINLISAHGQGRRRTLHDLRHTLADSLHIIHMNMRTYKVDYKHFLSDVTIQLKRQEASPQSLDSILGLIEKEERKSLLILHNFDELRCPESLNAGFNIDFFQALNSINHRDNIAMLCVSEYAYSNYLLQVDGSEIPLSNLDAKAMDLPGITYDQILAELHRRNEHSSEALLQQLALSLRNQPAPYSALENQNS